MAPAATMMRAAIAAAALLLAWRVVQVNAVEFDDSGRPRLPGDGASIEGPAMAQPVLERILAQNPAQVGALLGLAGIVAAAGDDARADGAYAAALALAPMDRRALALATPRLLRKDDPGALEILSRLVTHYPDTRPRAFALMADLLSSARYRPAWDAIVAADPDWMGPFVAHACTRGVDVAVLVPVLLGRSERGSATPAEAGCLIERLRRENRWEEAYHVWLDLLPRERLANVGFVFNGGFEHEPVVGFDWVPQPGAERQAGHVAELRPAPGAVGKRALRVAYNGKRQAGVPVRQFLALPAGEYRMAGRVRTEAIKALHGIHWTVRCLDGMRPLGILAGSERFLGSGEWRPFAMQLSVGESCRGQVLQLEPAGAGAVAFVSGTAWFDEISMTRR